MLGYSSTKTGSKTVLGYSAVYRINVIIYAAYVTARFSRRYYHPHHYFDCDYHYNAIVWPSFCLSPLQSRYSFAAPTLANRGRSFCRFAVRFPSLSDYTELVSRWDWTPWGELIRLSLIRRKAVRQAGNTLSATETHWALPWCDNDPLSSRSGTSWPVKIAVKVTHRRQSRSSLLMKQKCCSRYINDRYCWNSRDLFKL